MNTSLLPIEINAHDTILLASIVITFLFLDISANPENLEFDLNFASSIPCQRVQILSLPVKMKSSVEQYLVVDIEGLDWVPVRSD